MTREARGWIERDKGKTKGINMNSHKQMLKNTVNKTMELL